MKNLPISPPRGIFISYRRADTGPYARLLQMQLSARFPDVPVFMDLDSIEVGRDFAAVIRNAVNSCHVMVVLIGRQWETLADEEGHRRLDDANDYVRFEIRTALKHGVLVIPVLVDEARPARREQLPADLRRLARLSALAMSYDRYQYDADRLLGTIERALAEAAPERDQRRVLAAAVLGCGKDVCYRDLSRRRPAPASPTCLPVEALPQPKRDLKYVE